MLFTQLKLNQKILDILEETWYIEPTLIQQTTIPVILDKKDIIWLAQTWSWKTLAFVLPILNQILENKNNNIKALIIAPTRELVIQISQIIELFTAKLSIKSQVIIWGVNEFSQLKSIKKWVDILIATPKRLVDFLEEGLVDLSQIKYFVLDEADKMLDEWFLADVTKIMSFLPQNKQSMFFSATMPDSIFELANSFLKNYEIIKANQVSSTVDQINQLVYYVEKDNKRKLLQFLGKKSEFKSIIVFVKTKDDTEIVRDYIASIWNIKYDYIHRNRSQNARQRAVNSFKSWEIKVLIATDVLSRGIDIDNLSRVINYNMPGNSETYVHRIWRTGRIGKTWVAISMCMDVESHKIADIESLTWKKLVVSADTEYLDEVIPKWEFIWSFKVEENTVKKSKKRYYWKRK